MKFHKLKWECQLVLQIGLSSALSCPPRPLVEGEEGKVLERSISCASREGKGHNATETGGPGSPKAPEGLMV